jgi:hypothetical protein
MQSAFVSIAGSHHYYDLHGFGPSGTAATFASRDSLKQKLCREKGITLVAIPYWYEKERYSFALNLLYFVFVLLVQFVFFLLLLG